MANSYLNKTFGTPTNSAIWTFSAWIKRSSLSGSQKFFAAGSSSTDRTEMYFAGNTGEFYIYRNISGSTIELGSTRMFRDTSAWYNFVVQNNNGTVAVYVNGETVSISNSTSLGTNKINNASTAHYIGRQVADTSQNFDGYMSHVSFVDGSVVAPTVFGETDSTSGIWKFKSPSGVTWGNNGFHLKFENSGALGTDSSGESNTFTVNGNLKQSLSTPSNTYATPNPLENLRNGNTNNAPSYSNGSNTVTGSAAANHQWNCGFGISKGKWYWELKALASNPDASIGYRKQTNTNGSMQNLFGFSFANDKKRLDGALSGNAIGSTAQNDIYGMALDLDNGEMFIHRNGTYLSSGNPTTRANPFITTSDGLPSEGVFGGHVYDGSVDINFGEGRFGTTAISSAGSNGNGSLFEYDVPSGYYALNTKNINTYG